MGCCRSTNHSRPGHAVGHAVDCPLTYTLSLLVQGGANSQERFSSLDMFRIWNEHSRETWLQTNACLADGAKPDGGLKLSRALRGQRQGRECGHQGPSETPLARGTYFGRVGLVLCLPPSFQPGPSQGPRFNRNLFLRWLRRRPSKPPCCTSCGRCWSWCLRLRVAASSRFYSVITAELWSTSRNVGARGLRQVPRFSFACQLHSTVLALQSRPFWRLLQPAHSKGVSHGVY